MECEATALLQHGVHGERAGWQHANKCRQAARRKLITAAAKALSPGLGVQLLQCKTQSEWQQSNYAVLAVKACMQAPHASVLQYSTSVWHSTSTTALQLTRAGRQHEGAPGVGSLGPFGLCWPSSQGGRSECLSQLSPHAHMTRVSSSGSARSHRTCCAPQPRQVCAPPCQTTPYPSVYVYFYLCFFCVLYVAKCVGAMEQHPKLAWCLKPYVCWKDETQVLKWSVLMLPCNNSSDPMRGTVQLCTWTYRNWFLGIHFIQESSCAFDRRCSCSRSCNSHSTCWAVAVLLLHCHAVYCSILQKRLCIICKGIVG